MQAATVPPHARPRFRVRNVAVVLAGVLSLGALGSWVGVSLMNRSGDPWRTAPHLSGRVFDHVSLPTIGQTFVVGGVEVVLMSIVKADGGRWGIHLVLHSLERLPRYGTRIIRSDSARAPSTCAASGPSGWADCYIAVPRSLGATTELELVLDRESVGRFTVPLAPWNLR